MAQNEMRAMRGMPVRVRSLDGVGAAERCRAMAVNEATSCGNSRSWSSGFTSQSVPLGWLLGSSHRAPAPPRTHLLEGCALLARRSKTQTDLCLLSSRRAPSPLSTYSSNNQLA